MIEMPGNFQPALLAVGSVAYTEASLHAWLPRPAVDGVFATHVTSSVRRR